MNFEKSCGAIVFKVENERPLFVIVEEKSGGCSFPKGHMEGNETEIETARREIFEETGLNPVFIEGFSETETYDPVEKPGTRKQVVYFLAEYSDATLFPQPSEINRILHLPYEEALSCLVHENQRLILTAAYNFITHK